MSFFRRRCRVTSAWVRVLGGSPLLLALFLAQVWPPLPETAAEPKDDPVPAGLARTFDALKAAVTAVKFLPDGRSLLAAGKNGAVCLLDVETGKELRRLEGPKEEITSLAVSPIALHAGEGEALWAFGTLATVKASSETSDGRVAVIEQLAPQGAGSPLHVHHREDEWFYVLEGALTFWVGGETNDLETCRPLLEYMGNKIVHCGGPGTGASLKW